MRDGGGDIGKGWNLEEALAAGHRAVGVSVLQSLYAKMKDQPVSVDLATVWSQFGVQSDRINVRCDDSATLAAIRRAITAAESNALAEHLPRPPPWFARFSVESSVLVLAKQT